ncbi:MAG: 1-deoxy-D-xylulose-5-phosphate reductoisomerase [Neomegalonema sp.]|nr:1-deoxy-D-xylulose-5-phosphate reductoisomerase [Neomegalonema sp.]
MVIEAAQQDRAEQSGAAKTRSGGLPLRVSVFGATGSIGSNTLDVLRAHGGRDRFEIDTLSAHGNAQKLAALAREFGARRAVVSDESAYGALREALAGSGIEAAAGPRALCDAASEPVDWCMAAIAGAAGLASSISAARSARVVALANKETLVCAEVPFFKALTEAGNRLIPVDSEHSAIFQVFETRAAHAVERIILTASGGPFRTWSAEQIQQATREQALRHPNWSMGTKITIDSASMFNKALEVIETARLFPVSADQIEVVVHPQSIIHSMVAYADGSVLAQMGEPDMRTPIAYALGYPERIRAPVKALDLTAMGRLDFEPPDLERFPALRLARQALEAGGGMACILNAANEQAVAAFLSGRLRFGQIAELVEAVMAMPGLDLGVLDLEAIMATDQAARAAADRLITHWAEKG